MDISLILVFIFTFGTISFFIVRSAIYILRKPSTLSEANSHLPMKNKNKKENTTGSDYIFWGGLAICFLFVLEAYGQLLEENKHAGVNIVTKYTRYDGTPLTPSEVKEHLRIERISRKAEWEAHAQEPHYASRNNSSEPETAVDRMLVARIFSALERGDIRGACNNVMLYSGPSAVSTKLQIDPVCKKLGLSAFAGIGKY